jgi:hypothetical protein
LLPPFFPSSLLFCFQSSDDEFMQFDWSQIWYDELTGEKHLLIVPNSEHSLATGIPEVLETISSFAKSVALGHTGRPSFDYSRSNETGAVTVTIPKEHMKGAKVVLRHSSTLQSERRDFRWVRSAVPASSCKLPDIKLKKPMFGGNCLQPIFWLGRTLKDNGDGVFTAMPPEPKHGHWTGYYLEVFFPSDGGLRLAPFQFSTPGFTWPNALPFSDCHGASCTGTLV